MTGPSLGFGSGNRWLHPNEGRVLRYLAGLAAFSFLMFDPAYALQVASQQEVPKLTLTEAVERASRNNPGLQRVIHALEASALDRQDRWLDILPTPQVSLLSTDMIWARRSTAEDPFGEPLPREVVEWVQTSRSTRGVGLTASLSLGDLLQLRREEVQSETRELTLEVDRVQLRAEVTSAFVALQEHLERLELEEGLVAAAEVNLEIGRELYRLGLRDRIDLVTLELDSVEQAHNLAEVMSAVEEARVLLRLIIGDPTLDRFEIVPVAVEVFDPSGLDIGELTRIAVSESPVLRHAQAQVRMEEQSASMIRSEWLPTVSAFWNRQQYQFTRGGDAFLDPNLGGEWDGSVGFAITFPDLGQYFRRRVQQQRVELNVSDRREAHRETQNQLTQNVQSALNALRSNARSVELQERRALLAGERLELAREAYRIGSQSYIELQAALQQAAQAERQVIAARYAFERARIELERLLGMSIRQVRELDEEG